MPLAEPSTPCPKEDGEGGIALHTRLLELWSKGLLSVAMAAELAHLASIDGASSAELLRLAKCGNFGQDAGNISRALMTAYCEKLRLSKPLMVKAQALDPKRKSSTVTTAEAAIMLPHLVVADLGREYQEQFHSLFATDALEWFCSGVEKHRMTGSMSIR